MTCNEFLDIYWAHYISIEKDFRETMRYVTVNLENYKTFSIIYAKLILAIGSEVDIIAQIYCKMLDDSFIGVHINDYKRCICDKEPGFCTQHIEVLSTDIILDPWETWISDANPSNPIWWTAYNKVKHNRTKIGSIGDETREYYKFANQKNTLDALAGLYQLLMHIFLRLCESEKSRKRPTPLPGSRVFSIVGDMWTDTTIYNSDFAIWLEQETMTLHIEYGRLPY